jgi:hypothetical protein
VRRAAFDVEDVGGGDALRGVANGRGMADATLGQRPSCRVGLPRRFPINAVVIIMTPTNSKFVSRCLSPERHDAGLLRPPLVRCSAKKMWNGERRENRGNIWRKDTPGVGARGVLSLLLQRYNKSDN